MCLKYSYFKPFLKINTAPNNFIMFSVSSNNYVKPLDIIILPLFTIIYDLLVWLIQFFVQPCFILRTSSSILKMEYDSLVDSNIKMKSHEMNNPAFVLGIPAQMMNMQVPWSVLGWTRNGLNISLPAWQTDLLLGSVRVHHRAAFFVKIKIPNIREFNKMTAKQKALQN